MPSSSLIFEPITSLEVLKIRDLLSTWLAGWLSCKLASNSLETNEENDAAWSPTQQPWYKNIQEEWQYRIWHEIPDTGNAITSITGSVASVFQRLSLPRWLQWVYIYRNRFIGIPKLRVWNSTELEMWKFIQICYLFQVTFSVPRKCLRW